MSQDQVRAREMAKTEVPDPPGAGWYEKPEPESVWEVRTLRAEAEVARLRRPSTPSERDQAVKLLAENARRRYDQEFDADHLSWQDFAGQAAEDLAALAEAGLLRGSVPATPTEPKLGFGDTVPVYNGPRLVQGAVKYWGNEGALCVVVKAEELVTPPSRCSSCDHPWKTHHSDGCWFAVGVGTPDKDIVCSCSVARPASEGGSDGQA